MKMPMFSPIRQQGNDRDTKQSLLSSLVSSPCKYAIPQGLSVSFNADPGLHSNDGGEENDNEMNCDDERSQGDVIEFTAPDSDSNIIVMPCEPLADNATKNIADLLSTGTGHHRRVKTEFAALQSAFSHVRPQMTDCQSQKKLVESTPKVFVEGNKLRLKKTRIFSKPAPKVMMDTVISEEDQQPAVEKLPTFGATHNGDSMMLITFNTDLKLKD